MHKMVETLQQPELQLVEEKIEVQVDNFCLGAEVQVDNFCLCAEVQVDNFYFTLLELNHLPVCADLDISSADEDASHVSVHADVGIAHVIVHADVDIGHVNVHADVGIAHVIVHADLLEDQVS